MKDLDFEAFAKELALTAVVFDNDLVTAKTKQYFEDLKDLPLEFVILALGGYRRSGSVYFPKISEIRNSAIAKDSMTGEIAYAELLYQLMDVGGRRGMKGVFTDPIIDETVQYFNGIQHISHENLPNDKFFRINFIKEIESKIERRRNGLLTGRTPTINDRSKNEDAQTLANLYKQIDDIKKKTPAQPQRERTHSNDITRT